MRRWAPLLLLGLAVGCGASSGAPPDVLIITIDTLRPDRLSAYGFTGHETPGIDRLAEEGALFERAFCDTPWTTPSMASVMTGTYPTLHGFKSSNANRLGLEKLTLAEILQEHGYATAAVVGSFPLDSIYQLDQGFDTYDDAFTTPIWVYPGHETYPLESEFRQDPGDQAMFAMAKAMNDSRRTDAEVTDAAADWLREAPPGPFFLWVHYFGPHSKPDWSVPEDERLARQLARYEPDVRVTDREVGRLLDALDATGRAADALVVFHADHGESLGERGYVGHGSLLNEASMSIPLILRWPGRIAAGVRIPGLVRNVDILPTVLDAVGLPAPAQASGESLLPMVAATPGAALGRWLGGGPERTAYMETYYPAHVAFATPVEWEGKTRRVGTIRRGIRRGRWQLVRTEAHSLIDVREGTEPPPEGARRMVWREQLFDAEDADDGSDHLAREPRIAADLRALLDAQLEQERTAAPRLPVDPETRLRLEALGYGE
jgi:arylsulfatase A-like enzyme